MNIALLPAYSLFFLMLFIPATYQSLKLLLLIITLMIISIRLSYGYKLRLHPIIIMWVLFYLVLGTAFIIRGFAHNPYGALRVSTIYVIWPIVFTFFIGGGINNEILSNLIKLMVITTIIISFYAFLFMLQELGWLPGGLYIPIDQRQQMVHHAGYIEASFYSLDSLLFLVPFNLAFLLIWPKKFDPLIHRVLLWAATTIGIIIVFLSGRRALILVVILSPFLTMGLQCFLPSGMRRESFMQSIKSAIPIVLFIIFFLYYVERIFDIDLLSTYKMFTSGFQFDAELSAAIRKKQFYALIEGWMESPFFGKGHGTCCSGFLREGGDQGVCAYELSYVALLFYTGISGFLAYASGVLWIIMKSIQLIRSQAVIGLQMLPILVGMVSFLIGHATNPYLTKFDSMWTIFLPVAFINNQLIRSEGRQNAIEDTGN